MSYTTVNFKNKKEVKDAITAGREVRCFNPGIGPDLSNYTGRVFLEGPHAPKAHSWYGEGKMENGILVSIK